MLKYLLTATVAAAAVVAAIATTNAAEKKYTFALVPKNTNNPFFDQALAGCKKAEKELKGAIECLYIGPGEHGGGDEEAQIVADLVTKRVRWHRCVTGQRGGYGQCAPGGEAGQHPRADLGL